MIKTQNSLLAGLLFAALLFFVGCDQPAGGGSNVDADSTGGGDTDTTAVIKVEPQNFPVNELPDAYFGKEVIKEKLNSPAGAGNNLTMIGEPFPTWLDAIISRESIVMFANKILAEMPEELEFVQTSQQHYQAPQAWRGFKVLFTTRPSNVNIFIMGAYKDEENVYWMSLVERDAISVGIENIMPIISDNSADMSQGNDMQSGVMLIGKMGDAPFTAFLERETSKLDRKMTK